MNEISFRLHAYLDRRLAAILTETQMMPDHGILEDLRDEGTVQVRGSSTAWFGARLCLEHLWVKGEVEKKWRKSLQRPTRLWLLAPTTIPQPSPFHVKSRSGFLTNNTPC